MTSDIDAGVNRQVAMPILAHSDPPPGGTPARQAFNRPGASTVGATSEDSFHLGVFFSFNRSGASAAGATKIGCPCTDLVSPFNRSGASTAGATERGFPAWLRIDLLSIAQARALPGQPSLVRGSMEGLSKKRTARVLFHSHCTINSREQPVLQTALWA